MNAETETIALNIITILKRTGNEWRDLSWDEYKSERLKDGGFTDGEFRYFERAKPYTLSPECAANFGGTWKKIFNEHQPA